MQHFSSPNYINHDDSHKSDNYFYSTNAKTIFRVYEILGELVSCGCSIQFIVGGFRHRTCQVPNLHTRKAAMADISLPCDHTLTEYILRSEPGTSLYGIFQVVCLVNLLWSLVLCLISFRLILQCTSCCVTEIPSQSSVMITLIVVYRPSLKPTTLGNGKKCKDVSVFIIVIDHTF